MTKDTMENPPFKGNKKGQTGVTFTSPSIPKVRDAKVVTIRRR